MAIELRDEPVQQASPAIELKAASKRFSAASVVGPIDLAVARGEFVALLGRSGCGKTTTLKMINGLLSPDSGMAKLAGFPENQSAWRRRRRIGYVFQDVGLFEHMSIADNIAVGPRLARWDRARVDLRVSELLDIVGLPAAIGRRAPAELSGGQRQRIGLARALATEPEIMLMDEPFGSLDPLSRDRIGRDYRALHERLGLTTVMVTHDVMEALLLADRLVVMDDGRVIGDGDPGALLRGHSEARVRNLMETPRRQALRLARLARDVEDEGFPIE